MVQNPVILIAADVGGVSTKPLDFIRWPINKDAFVKQLHELVEANSLGLSGLLLWVLPNNLALRYLEVSPTPALSDCHNDDVDFSLEVYRFMKRACATLTLPCNVAKVVGIEAIEQCWEDLDAVMKSLVPGKVQRIDLRVYARPVNQPPVSNWSKEQALEWVKNNNRSRKSIQSF
ncbi:hypothetical protein [Hydromonas duriensis]|uniref:Uncharacterized protein n=1 Tax=Hydromonas duriensis TaxID=1527608 RepID=A0A4R6Y1C1_9BURK|nr:hypothetical protein [Hydromonas duriensis]TDR28946.1 hypothetical protein DFR44_13015 [Hydromonas duriensis]